MSSSSVLNIRNLPTAQGSSIGAAWGEVATAFSHLASALVRSAFTSSENSSKPLTAFEEAEALRTYAAEFQARDPEFAMDLFAAADRHEIEALKTGAVA
jgi:hypothetical protein